MDAMKMVTGVCDGWGTHHTTPLGGVWKATSFGVWLSCVRFFFVVVI